MNGSRMAWLVPALLAAVLTVLSWMALETRELRIVVAGNYQRLSERITENEKGLAGQREALLALSKALDALRLTLDRALPGGRQ